MSLKIGRRLRAATAAARSEPSWLNRLARRALKHCGRRERASMAVLIAIGVPALLGFGALAIDGAYYGYRNLLLRQTVQAAALAAGNKLSTYYVNPPGSTTAIVGAAQSFARLNMPTATYGTVVGGSTTTDVIIGTWDTTNLAFSSGGASPNAVKVVGTNTSPLFLGDLFGKPNITLTASVIASYTSGKAFNTIVINDLSQSFSGEILNQRSADQAILNCVKGASGSTTKFGITGIGGHAVTLQSLTQASTSLTTLLTLIATINECGSLLMPACGGSNIAAGIYSAISQFSGTAYNNTTKNIVIITDGAPNVGSTTYSPADGVTTCTSHCHDSDLLTAAQTQAARAAAAGINISTIYYTGTDGGSSASSLASLVTGTGIAMVAPTTASISASYAGFCSTIPSALKTVM